MGALAAGEHPSKSLHGRILDVDSHEMVSTYEWSKIFGPASAYIAKRAQPYLARSGEGNLADPDFPGDIMEINDESVWITKGTNAPGAADFTRRIQVIDQMGIRKQFVFPTSGLVFGQLADGNSPISRMAVENGDPAEEVMETARAAMGEYNAWVVRATNDNPDRLRPVPYLWHGAPIDELVAQASGLIAGGVKAVHLSCGAMTAGLSPGNPDLDPFWSLLEKNDVPLLFHVGHGSKFPDPAWGFGVPAFKPGKVESVELGSTPYPFFSMHYAPQNYLSVMVLSGVFERFPRLRVGIIELGASWLGPFAEHLDMWAQEVYKARFAPYLSMLPSEYLARNVRVTPFNTFEHIDTCIARYPKLVDCFCYSTDYPHVEGGKDSLRSAYDRVAPFGQEMVEKFFVRNAEWILP